MVEMRAILAVFQAWSCCDRCEGAALLAKLLPKKTASAQPVLLSFRRHRQCYLKSRPPIQPCNVSRAHRSIRLIQEKR